MPIKLIPIVRRTIDIVNLSELKVWMGKLKTISLYQPINTNHMEGDTYKIILTSHDGIQGRKKGLRVSCKNH